MTNFNLWSERFVVGNMAWLKPVFCESPIYVKPEKGTFCTGGFPVWAIIGSITPGNKCLTYLTSFTFLFQLTKFTKMNVWAYFFYWSGSYPTGPDDASCRSPRQKRAYDPTEICD